MASDGEAISRVEQSSGPSNAVVKAMVSPYPRYIISSCGDKES